MAQESRRLHQRFPCSLPVQLYDVPGRRSPIPGVLVDLSIGGARLRLRVELPPGAFSLELSDAQGGFRVKARIQRAIGRPKDAPGLFEYGLGFEPHMSNAHRLRRVVDAQRRSGGGGALQRDYWKL